MPGKPTWAASHKRPRRINWTMVSFVLVFFLLAGWMAASVKDIADKPFTPEQKKRIKSEKSKPYTFPSFSMGEEAPFPSHDKNGRLLNLSERVANQMVNGKPLTLGTQQPRQKHSATFIDWTSAGRNQQYYSIENAGQRSVR